MRQDYSSLEKLQAESELKIQQINASVDETCKSAYEKSFDIYLAEFQDTLRDFQSWVGSLKSIYVNFLSDSQIEILAELMSKENNHELYQKLLENRLTQIQHYENIRLTTSKRTKTSIENFLNTDNLTNQLNITLDIDDNFDFGRIRAETVDGFMELGVLQTISDEVSSEVEKLKTELLKNVVNPKDYTTVRAQK